MRNTTPPFKRLILRAVLNDLSPIVARVFSIPDDVEITELHDVFLSMLGWQHDLGFVIRVHGQEFNSYQRRSRGKRLRDFQLRRQEKFFYVCNTLDLWEWEIRVLDVQAGSPDERDPKCLAGRGAAPPEHCGGPRGYRLMLKRQVGGPQRIETLRATGGCETGVHPGCCPGRRLDGGVCVVRSGHAKGGRRADSGVWQWTPR